MPKKKTVWQLMANLNIPLPKREERTRRDQETKNTARRKPKGKRK
jgi:hypothetical protein